MPSSFAARPAPSSSCRYSAAPVQVSARELGAFDEERAPAGAAEADASGERRRRRWQAAGLALGVCALLGFAGAAVSGAAGLRRSRAGLGSAEVLAEQASSDVSSALLERAVRTGGAQAALTDTVAPKSSNSSTEEQHPGYSQGAAERPNSARQEGTGNGKKAAAASQAAVRCPGYGDGCEDLAYPMPYGPGKWPTSYDYSGEFPKDFVWGFGTAAYQVEGAYREDGRGASIWDTFSGADTVGMPGAGCSYCCKEAPCEINPAMFDKGATGNVASDHYHMYKTDIALMKSMGLKNYRFSISWSRLIPTGKLQDGVNEKAKAFYNNLIDGLLEAGVSPYVTLYHWDLPQGLLDPAENKHAWWSRDPKTGKPDGQILPDWLDYVRVCFEEFGDRVKVWVTFNEAWSFLYLGSGWGKAPSIPEYSNMTIDPYVGGHNVLLAHATAVDVYRREFQAKQGGQIGITNNCEWREPKSDDPQDIAAAERAVLFQLGWFSEPIFGKDGDYPAHMRRLYGDRLPQFTADQKKLLKGSADFFGLNHYGTGWVSYNASEPGEDLSYAEVSHEGLPRAMSVWLYGAGWGLRKILNWIAQHYDNPPLFVTEGGWSLPADNAVEAVADKGRVMYYANYTSEILKAIRDDGVDVRGYFAWSLIDNYEWERGYQERFGTTYNDFQFGEDENGPANNGSQPTAGEQWRRRKDSSCWLEAVYRHNKLVSPSGPAFGGCVGASVFQGEFQDPNHPGCPRHIEVDATIRGWDPRAPASSGCGSSEKGKKKACREAAPPKSCDGKTDEAWTAQITKVSGGSIIVDLSGKGGPERLAGFWNSGTNSIDWADGNSWKLVGDAQASMSM